MEGGSWAQEGEGENTQSAEGRRVGRRVQGGGPPGRAEGRGRGEERRWEGGRGAREGESGGEKSREGRGGERVRRWQEVPDTPHLKVRN